MLNCCLYSGSIFFFAKVVLESSQFIGYCALEASLLNTSKSHLFETIGQSLSEQSLSMQSSVPPNQTDAFHIYGILVLNNGSRMHSNACARKQVQEPSVDKLRPELPGGATWLLIEVAILTDTQLTEDALHADSSTQYCTAAPNTLHSPLTFGA